jgi:hypothetical protein
MLIERFIEDPHHIEIQVVADTHGNVIAFPERLVRHPDPAALLHPFDITCCVCMCMCVYAHVCVMVLQGVLSAEAQPEGGGGEPLLSLDPRHQKTQYVTLFHFQLKKNRQAVIPALSFCAVCVVLSFSARTSHRSVQGHWLSLCWDCGDAVRWQPELLLPRDEHSSS